MEREAYRMNGFVVLVALIVVAAALVLFGMTRDEAFFIVSVVVAAVILFLPASGFAIVNPNEAKVVQFFGRYIGTIKTAGFTWTVPFTDKNRISLRVRNFETTKLKVNDADGNPVEIGAVGGLPGRRHRQGLVLGGRLRELRRHPVGDRRAAPGDDPPVRLPHRGPHQPP